MDLSLIDGMIHLDEMALTFFFLNMLKPPIVNQCFVYIHGYIHLGGCILKFLASSWHVL